MLHTLLLLVRNLWEFNAKKPNWLFHSLYWKCCWAFWGFNSICWWYWSSTGLLCLKHIWLLSQYGYRSWGSRWDAFRKYLCGRPRRVWHAHYLFVWYGYWFIHSIWLNTDTQYMSGVKIANENTTNGCSGEPSKSNCIQIYFTTTHH